MNEINENQRETVEISVSFAGDTNVGKTCIINRILKGFFEENIQNTVGSNDYQYTNESSEPITKFTICDTAGQDNYRQITPFIFKRCNVFVIVYSVENSTSLESVESWAELINDNRRPGKCLFYLVENKNDIRSKGNEIVIPIEEGKQVAEKIGAHFMSVSAKTGDNITNLVDQISADYINQIYSNNEETKTEKPIDIDEVNNNNNNDPNKKDKCC